MDKVLTLQELQETLKIGRNKTLQLAKTEGFPAIKLGGRTIIPVAALDKWLESNVGQEYNI